LSDVALVRYVSLRTIAMILGTLIVAATVAAQAAALPTLDTAAHDPAPALTPEQARQALDLIQDDKKRADLLRTLQAIAIATPAPPPAARQELIARIPLSPQGLGAKLLVQSASWIDELSTEAVATTRAVTNLPIFWQWLVHSTTDPAARRNLLDAAWKLLVLIGCALAAEWAVLRFVVRMPLAAIEAYAHHRRGEGRCGKSVEPIVRADGGSAPLPSPRHAWQTLRILPAALAHTTLEAMPILAFAAVGNLLLGATLGELELARLLTLVVLNAYVACRGVMCLVRMLVSPNNEALRLVQVSGETAAYIEIWVRRIAFVAVYGAAVAESLLLLGLQPAAHDALLKLVSLVVHLFFVVIVLQCRSAVAERIRAPETSRGALAVLRNRLAELWHLIAIFLLLAQWVVWAIDLRNGLSLLGRYVALTAIALAAARFVSTLALGGLNRTFRIAPTFVKRYPGLEARANRYYPLLRGTISGIISMITAVILLQAWGVDAVDWFRSGSIGGSLISAAMTICLTAVAAAAIWECTNAAIDRHLARLASGAHLARAARLRTLLPMLRTTLLVAIFIVVGLMTLSEIGVNVAPLIAGAGILGVAIGFGSQKLVQDLITGVFLLLENAMQVGDRVTVSGLSGTVENLSIRTIRLRASDGSVHIIPFSAVTSVTNTNRGIGNAAISVNVSLTEDTDRVSEVLEEIARNMRKEPAFERAMLGDFELWGVDKVDASVATIVGQIVCTAAGRWSVQREFNRRMKMRFQELGIAIANPTHTIMLWAPPEATAEPQRHDEVSAPIRIERRR
jgi:small-conductance mechanosensitive channel